MILGTINQLWHAAPLIVAISLVYSGTRHEEPAAILEHAIRLGLWITGFMGVVAALLFLVAWWL
jgi:hypothetical protein